MNEETKRKHCHLLMFDMADAITTPSSDCSNPLNGNSVTVTSSASSLCDFQQPFIYAPYENPEFQIIPITSDCHFQQNLAATSQNSYFNNQVYNPTLSPPDFSLRNDMSDNIRPPTKKPKKSTKTTRKTKEPKRTPRPPNAFILYRKSKQPEIVKLNKDLTNAEVSKVISKCWWKETEKERFRWEKLADRIKLDHMQKHPDYVYQPKKAGSKRRKLNKKYNNEDDTTLNMVSATTSTFRSRAQGEGTTATQNSNSKPMATLALKDDGVLSAIAETAFANQSSAITKLEAQHQHNNFVPPTTVSTPPPLSTSSSTSSSSSPSTTSSLNFQHNRLSYPPTIYATDNATGYNNDAFISDHQPATKSGPYFGAMQFPECFTATTTPEYVSPAAVETPFLESVPVHKYHHANQPEAMSSSEPTDYFMIQPHQLHPCDGEYNHDSSCTQYVGGNTMIDNPITNKFGGSQAWLIDADLELDWSDDSLTRVGEDCHKQRALESHRNEHLN